MAEYKDLTRVVDTLKRNFGSHSILDSLIPGYSVVSNVLKAYLGIDVSRILPWLGLVFALSKFLNHVYDQLRYQVLEYLSCSILLTSDLETYRYVTRFLADTKGVGVESSELMAISNKTLDGSYIDREYEEEEEALRGEGRVRHIQEYEPMVGYYKLFWHKGKLFLWSRDSDRRFTHDSMPLTTSESRLHCFSMTSVPIKQLIEEATMYHESKTVGRTSIYRKDRYYGWRWRSGASRPSRPMSTIIFDKVKKKQLVEDIKQYLLPGTRKWYAQRGIPYRRGYLFHGPPGTGKSSMSFALAGVLDLDIYCLSLAEKSMTEDDLLQLFDNLPRQCVVLLEDIDTAGIQKRDDKAVDGKDSDEDEKTDSSKDSKSSSTKKDSDSRVSLSGLLNALDGISSQEGRVLVMTTNDPDALDKALLRPGRIDVKVHFGRASKQDAHDLFIHTYMDYTGDLIDEDQEVPEKLEQVAQQFAAEVPDAKHSIAELQGYLLVWKNNQPEEALANIKAWLDSQEVKDMDDLTNEAPKTAS